MSKRERRKKESLALSVPLSLPPPRNPLVAQALMRRAGSHRKGIKSERQRAQRQLRQSIEES